MNATKNEPELLPMEWQAKVFIVLAIAIPAIILGLVNWSPLWMSP